MKRAFFCALLGLAACSGDGGVGFSGAQDAGAFREVLERGGIPEDIDPVGFFQEHALERKGDLCDEPLCARAMLSVHRDWLYKKPQALLHVDLATALDEQRDDPVPLDLVVVVDTSASMVEEDRLAYVQSGLDQLVDTLEADDRVAVVAYGTEARVVLELTSDADAAHEAVASLEAGGSTNLHDGLELGLGMAEDAIVPARAARVILLSDGRPTKGIVGVDAIVAMADDHLEAGMALSTVGVGDGYDPTLLTTLAEHGGGGAYFVEDPEAVTEVFTEELASVLYPIARDVELVIEPGTAYRFGEAVGAPGIERQGDDVHIAIPAVFHATRRDGDGPAEGRRGGGGAIFVEAVLESQNGHERVGSVTLRYRATGERETRETRIDIDTPVAPGAAPDTEHYSHDAMIESYAIYNMFLGLRAATRAASCELDCALVALDRVEASAAAFLKNHPEADLQADLDLLRRFELNVERKMASWRWKPSGTCPCDDLERCCPGGDDACAVAARARGRHPTPLAVALLAVALAAVAARRRR
jgi:Ca-activated chloride channel family protein